MTKNTFNAPKLGEVKRIALQLGIVLRTEDDSEAVTVKQLFDFANVFYLRALNMVDPMEERNKFIIAQFKKGKTQKEIAEMMQPPMKETRVNQIILAAGLNRFDGGAHVRGIKRRAKA